MIAYLCISLFVILMAIGRPGTALNNDLLGRVVTASVLAAVSIGVVFREQVMDTFLYVRFFEFSSGTDLGTAIQVSPYDRVWTILQWTISHLSGSAYFLLAVVWILFIFGLMILLRRLFAPWQVALVLFSYAVYPFFYSYASNTVRQGVALSFVLAALCYALGSNRVSLRMLVLLAAAVVFHWSAAPFAAIVLILVKLKPRLRHLVLAWCAIALVFVTNIQRLVLAPLLPYVPRLDEYTSFGSLAVYSRVNRLDFLLFSGFWIVLALLMNRYYCADQVYGELIKYYIVWNCVFLLFGFVTFSDRLAGYSWFLIPILVWYPILKRPNYSVALPVVAAAASIMMGFAMGTFTYFGVG